MLPGVLCLVCMATLTVAVDNNAKIVLDIDDEGLHHLHNISFENKEIHEELLSRNRRQINNKEWNLWPKAIVPYTVLQYSMYLKPEYVKAMWVYEANTCIRFVPWNETTNEIYGLGHDGHLVFQKWDGCSTLSTKVVKSKNGLPISCCSNEECIHELGHTLGFHHEQGNILREGWIRINEKNVWPEAMTRRRLHTDEDYMNLRFPFDISSVMLYSPQLYAFGGWDYFTQKFPELRYKRFHFQQFKELALSYKCNQYSPCNGKQLGCVNGGYTSIVYGKCQCVCPEGLDPAALCAQPLWKVIMPWPKGQYSLPMSKNGCPGGDFETISANLKGVTMETSSDDTDMTKAEFCSRKEVNGSFTFATHEEEKWNWPLGNYCIYKVGDKCPFGFSPGSVYTGESSTDHATPIDQVNGSVSIHFCCQYRGFTWNPSYLPTDQPFSVIKLTGSCQDITGMKTDQSVVKYIGKGFKSEGSVPNLEISDTEVSMTLCHYTKTDMKCGEGIILDSKNRETTIEFSSEGRSDLECTWVIRGDTESGTLVLDFDNINIKKENGKCVDRLEIKHALLGQTGYDYCGQYVDHSIRSITNKLLFRLFTVGQSDSSFKVKVKWVPNDDLCYDTYDRGISYNGLVNYTRLFEPCLPWAQTEKCYDDPFLEGKRRDNMDGNYCRNPDNSFRPWCYTSIDKCRRNYCDVCGLETPYDKFYDCGRLKDAGFCDMDANIAAKYCPATCKEFLSPNAKPVQKFSEIKCERPIPPSDGKMVGKIKSSYNLGEQVKVQCKTSPSMVTISTCMTSGDWSPVPHACLGCPVGSVEYNGCYIMAGENGVWSYNQAADICSKIGGIIPSPKNIYENRAMISAFRESHVWIGINDKEKEGTWVDGDGTPLTWTNWNKGEPNNYRNNEDCAFMDNEGGWLDYPCSGYKANIVCKVNKTVLSQCNDYLGERCVDLLVDNYNMCVDHPSYAKTFCRKTCRICRENEEKCFIEVSDTNVEILSPVNSEGSISIGEAVTYGCKKYLYKHAGDYIRSCLPGGNLTGQPLQCGECPLGFTSSQHTCHGLIPGQMLNFKEAREACRNIGGYVAMPKSPAENDIISSAALEFTVWLGLTLKENENEFLWEDGSEVYWIGEKGDFDANGDDCVVLGGDKKWYNIKCDSNKYSTVCTIPKSDNYVCYDITDKGATYDGRVNVTKSNTPCVSWTETNECNVNAWKMEKKFHNLDYNYCRNPDNDAQPWCYTTSTCHFDYCDVCGNQGHASDTATDCGIQRDKGVCTNDVTKATHECGGTCSDLLPNTGHVYYREVKCQPPKVPLDGIVVSKTRSEYHVGDEVTFKCKYNKFVVSATCLTTGDWSDAGMACPECPVGYELRDEMCYGRHDMMLSYDKAAEECGKVGATLPNPKSWKENEMLKTFNGGKYSWIGVRRKDYSEPFIHYPDGPKVSWTNWATKSPFWYRCVAMDTNGHWESTQCNFIRPDLTLTCVVPRQNLSSCADVLDTQCPQLLSKKPTMCKDHTQFTREYCPKTCGYCTDGVSKCKLHPLVNGITTVTEYTDIAVGDHVQYKCPKYKYPVGGDVYRACQVDGTLTGSDLVCDASCPPNAVLRDEMCYVFKKERVTFPKAKEECNAMGGFVGFPKNAAENNFLESINQDGGTIWLGVTDIENEGNFLFEDGTKVQWSNWDYKQPDNYEDKEDCVTLLSSKRWNDIDCGGVKYNYICALPLLPNVS